MFSTTDINQLSIVTRLDAVGFNGNTGGGVCDLLREGTPLPPVAGSNTEHSFFRKLCDFTVGVGCTTLGFPKDTNSNNVDLMFADTGGTLISGVPQKLGAPGPENLASPLRRDLTVNLGLLDNTKTQAQSPNRVRDLTPGSPGENKDFGTMSVRRRIVNNTGGDVTRLRFRIVELTSFPSPGGGQADLRALTTTGSFAVSGINDPANLRCKSDTMLGNRPADDARGTAESTERWLVQFDAGRGHYQPGLAARELTIHQRQLPFGSADDGYVQVPDYRGSSALGQVKKEQVARLLTHRLIPAQAGACRYIVSRKTLPPRDKFPRPGVSNH